MEDFFKIFCKKYSVEEKDAINLLNNMTERKYFKNDIIIKQGQVNTGIYILKEGMGRAVRFVKQKESTICIITEGQAFCSTDSLIKESIATLSIQAIKDSIVYTMSKKEVDEFALKYPIFYDIKLNVLEEMILDLTTLQVIFMDYPNAVDRYKMFFELGREIYDRVPLKYIAFQLNIATQSLSRIRKELKK